MRRGEAENVPHRELSTEFPLDLIDSAGAERPEIEAYDWSNVYGIAFKFQSDTNPQEVLSLNGSYAETVPLTAPAISTLFTSDANDEGPRILGPAPVTALREAFCNSITLDMANLDELTKGHIAQLIDSCPVQFVQPGSPNQRIRNSHEFNSAGREAFYLISTNGNSRGTGRLMTVPANYFNSIYTDDNNIPTDTNADAVVTTPHSSGPSFPPNKTILTVPIKPAESEAQTAIQVPSSCVTSSSATTDLLTNKLIDSDVVATPSNTIASIPLVTANLGLLQPVGPIADTPSVTTPRYIRTWTYSPHSESVSLRRVQSNSVSIKSPRRVPVTAPSVTPSALTSFGHHSVPPSAPANFGWTFHPQNEIATFRRLPKSVPSPQPPSRIRLLPAEDTDLPNATPAYIPSLQSPCHNQICFHPYHQPFLLRLSKRHRDALKVKMYHLHANILSMNWFYDTLD
eukprot:jgi/Psemu1/42783/gm1.42783_g